MRDPYVESLRYIAEPTGNTSYSNPPPLEYDNDLCMLTLADGVLVVKPKDHYAAVLQAREVIEQFLQAWEIDADLLWGIGTIRFTYKDHIVIDRNPLQSDNQSSQTLLVGAASGVWVTGSATLKVTRANYPKPPLLLQLTPDVETMWLRYRGYLEGREPLPAMAYFCLTVVEANAGGSKLAAQQYNLDKKILDKLGYLTSEHRGDPKTVRKVKKGQSPRPLSGPEQHWVEEAVKALIRRMGEYRPGQMIAHLSMRDLPPL